MLNSKPKFEDYDDWGQLAKSDPEAFEERRRAVIETFLAGLPQPRQDRLRRLQWRLDMERKRAANPTAAYVKLYQMMWESFAGDDGLVMALTEPEKLRANQTQAPRASVLNFDRERD